jgi:hypothetical protein
MKCMKSREKKKESHAHSITSRRVRELRLRDVRGRNEKPRMALSVEQCRKSAQVHAGNSIVCISSMHIQYTLFRVIYREVACWLLYFVYGVLVKTWENKKSRKEDRQSEYYDYSSCYDLDTYSIVVMVLYRMVLRSHADTYSTGLSGGSTIQTRSEGSRSPILFGSIGLGLFLCYCGILW